MARFVRKSKEKKMRPVFFVFCEGETEVAYVNFLKSRYRLPIEIIPKKSDTNISCRYIENCKRGYTTTDIDKTFVMYDLDVVGVLEKLNCIPNIILLASNPCVELWFLLHVREWSAGMDTKTCIKKYKTISNQYMKGRLNMTDVGLLLDGEDNAVARAKRMQHPDNPSTTVYRLIECLRDIRKEV